VLVPVNGGGVGGGADAGRPGQAARLGQAARQATGQPAGTSRQGQAFAGAAAGAAVGALFTENAGKLGQHFCTASVVHSPEGDLAVTAAHCVSGQVSAGSGVIAFAPGYVGGHAPYGVWQVTRVYTDQAWRAAQDPDHDVAFLRLSSAGAVPVEHVTGAERLGTGWPARSLVQVTGYPDGQAEPVRCVNWTESFTPSQLEFDCGGYTDGTSGGPFLARVCARTGQGTVIGVIGGYQQGGDTPDVSYSIVFGAAVASLYQTAEAGR
jgi:V8-like Glu-specific endopeptidase